MLIFRWKEWSIHQMCWYEILWFKNQYNPIYQTTLLSDTITVHFVRKSQSILRDAAENQTGSHRNAMISDFWMFWRNNKYIQQNLTIIYMTSPSSGFSHGTKILNSSQMDLNQKNIMADWSKTSVTPPDPLRTDLRSGQTINNSWDIGSGSRLSTRYRLKEWHFSSVIGLEMSDGLVSGKLRVVSWWFNMFVVWCVAHRHLNASDTTACLLRQIWDIKTQNLPVLWQAHI